MTQREMNDLIKETILEMDKQTGLKGIDIPIKFSSAVKTKGCFGSTIKYEIKNNRKVIKEFQPAYFKFSKYLFDGRYTVDIIKEVIKHEYIHYYCSVKYPTKKVHHGYEFKSACRKFGVNDSTTFNYDVNDDFKNLDSEKKLVYVISCTNCGQETIRQKKSRLVTDCKSYRCAICGGILECKQDRRVLS